VLFGYVYSLKIDITADCQEDGITEAQENACLSFKKNQTENLRKIEELLAEYAGTDDLEELSGRFEPTALVFWRNGNYAMTLSDEEEPDDGVAVTLSPEEGVVTQDEYLTDNYD
jgi:hypothetical protein